MSTVLITGANRGLGLGHVKAFLAAPSAPKVIAAVRAPKEADELNALATDAGPSRLQILAYDAADRDAPATVRAAIGDSPIDILFNNAGVAGGLKQSLGDLDPDAFLDTVAINALAPILLTRALADNIAASGRKLVANQSSRMGSIADNGSGGMYAYRASKAALNMATKSLANDLRPRGISVIALHPGWVRTRMGGSGAPLSPEDSVAAQQKILARADLQDSGSFFDITGEPLPW